MTDPNLPLLLKARRAVRFDWWMNVNLAVITCVFGGICLYAAIDSFLVGYKLVGAVNTAVAFVQSYYFCTSMHHIAGLNDVDARLRKIQREIFDQERAP